MSGTIMVKCPSCERSQPPRLLCGECGKPIGAAVDCFAALELSRSLVIDSALLERRYHELGRRLHPDRFAAAPAKLRGASLRSTALLTRAYRTLRDPVNRGLYWLELNGRKLAENNKSVPAELAELVFAVQEQLAELREARSGRSDTAEDGRTAVEERRVELQSGMDEVSRGLERNFARWDGAEQADREALFSDLKSILSKIAYLRTLIRDVDRELNPAQAA